MDAYDSLAVAYGTLTADYDYDRWLTAIEALARDAGLEGNRLLDVACGTGSSFLPLRDRYEVVGCDLSQGMLRQAAARAGEARVRLFRHDMRRLPELGSFDLVLCLDDSMNHLLEPDDVQATLRGIAANLAPAGVAVFDVNTLSTLRWFSSQFVTEDENHVVMWRGEGPADLPPRGTTSVRIDVFARAGGLYERSHARILERHYPVDDVVDYLAAAGLELVRVLGQSTGVQLEDELDEMRHGKALFVARRRAEAGDLARAA
jgi:SAM-dependent methyltransferase